jgi:hypothetical protein
VLRGSSSKWRGSQYISTTASLECAVKFAAPFNPIVKIDVARFLAAGGNVVDLRDTNTFAALVPPVEDEDGSRERAAVLERAQITSDLLKRMKVRHRHDLSFSSASATQTSCTPRPRIRRGSARDSFQLTRTRFRWLDTKSPACLRACVELLSATVVTTGISELPYG